MTATAAWSLRRRLAWRILLAASLIWALTLGVGLGVMWHEMGEVANDALVLHARTIAHLADAAEATPAPASDSEFVVRVTRRDAPREATPWQARADDGLSSGDGWIVAQQSTPKGTIVEVGQPIRSRRKDFLEAARVWLILTVPLLGLLLGVVLRTVRTSLAPVTGFASGMEGRSASDLSPITDTGLPEELLPIPHALNRYLARIEALLRSERSFSANAAHELRTPLAVASAQAQLIAEGRNAPEAARAIIGAVARLTATVDRLLELARAEAGTGRSGDRSDLVRVLRLIVADAPEGRIRFDDGDFEAMEVEADSDTVALVLGNLVRNAVQHGAGRVTVALRGGARVEVSNPAPPDARFLEGRFAAGPSSGGTGLGLAIARATAERLGWQLDLKMSDGLATATVVLGQATATP